MKFYVTQSSNADRSNAVPALELHPLSSSVQWRVYIALAVEMTAKNNRV